MMGSAGGVYGARRTVAVKFISTGGKAWKGGDTKFELTERWADFEKVYFVGIILGTDFGIDFRTYL